MLVIAGLGLTDCRSTHHGIPLPQRAFPPSFNQITLRSLLHPFLDFQSISHAIFEAYNIQPREAKSFSDLLEKDP